MKLYTYEAQTDIGKKVEGEIESNSKQEVANSLQNQGLLVIHISEGSKFSLQKLINLSIGRVSLNERVIFMKQFSTMVSSGLPITDALETLSSQVKSGEMKKIMEGVLQDVKSGVSLTVAFKKYPGLFNEIQANLVEAGEKSGKLVEIIAKISSDLDKQKNFVGKVKGAMIYPIIIFIAIALIMVLLMITMVPAIETLFKGFKAELPWITQAMISFSNFVNPTKSIGGILVITLIVAAVLGVKSYRNTKAGRLVTDRIILKIPVIGKITKLLNTEEFCRILSMLIQSGVPIIESLRITAGAMNNLVYKNAVLGLIPQVEKGFPIVAPLLKSSVFPNILSRMVGTGEQTGKLDKVLNDMGKYYGDELEDIIANLSKIMEPLILLIVGFFVAVLAVAVYLPVYQLTTVVK